MEESNSMDDPISNIDILIRNQQLEQEAKRLNQENANFEKQSNSKDTVISKLLLKNQQLSEEVKGLKQENARFEDYVVDSINSLRGNDDIQLGLKQIYRFCDDSGLSSNELPRDLQNELQELIKKKITIEEEINRILHTITGRSPDRWGMELMQSNFQQLNLNGNVNHQEHI